jgi:DNA polymerase-1
VTRSSTTTIEVTASSSSLRHLLREALALGAAFRLSGTAVQIENFTALPETLQHALRAHVGYLWSLINAEQDSEPVLLLQQLGVTPVLVQTRVEARSAVRQLLSDLSKHDGPLGLDIETSPLPKYAKSRPCARFNRDGCISDRQPSRKDFQDPAGTDSHQAEIMSAQLFAGSKRCFIFRGDALDLLLHSHWLRRQWLCAHNLGFELSFLMSVGYRQPEDRRIQSRQECTQQAAGLVIGVGHGGEMRGLDNAAAALLGVTVPKEYQLSDWRAAKLSPGQLAYAAGDAVLTRRLWERISSTLDADGLDSAYELQRRAIVPVADMERRGLKLDAAEHSRQVDTWSRELAAARQFFMDITGSPPPQTDDETRTWLSGVLPADELADWKRTPSGKLSVDADHLSQLGHIPAARPLLDLRARERLLNTFGPKLIQHVSPATRRIHASFLIAATKAGRFSCRNPNLQNLPRAPEFRQCIVAEKGNALIVADYSQIEMRVAAHISQDQALSHLFASGDDIHRASAARIIGIPVDEVTDEQRQQAKAVSFGSLYGQGAQGLADSAFVRFKVEMSLEQAQSALDGFFTAYPNLHRHLQHNVQICRRRGYIRIEPSGRIVRTEWEGGYLSYQQCCNLPIQGGAADLMLLAIQFVYRAFRKARIRGGLIATVHDELIAEVAADDATAAAEIMHREMVQAFEISFPGAPTTELLAVKSGRNWREAKEESQTPADHPVTITPPIPQPIPQPTTPPIHPLTNPPINEAMKCA